MASSNPQIKIPDLQLEIRAFFKEFREKVEGLQSSFNTYNSIVIGVLLLGFMVLLFALATLLVQSWQFNTTFQNESNQLRIQQDLIKNTVDVQKTLLQSQQEIKNNLDEIKSDLQNR
ncbi:MAG: hypothetical protein PHV63_02690 [Candidatus Daviesbacteria bacterium]|nr:hypothetical protein [Candidatus Daviesbacteria bacterium]